MAGSENTWIIGLDLGGTKLASAIFMKPPDEELVFVAALENMKYDTIFDGLDPKTLTSEGKSTLIESAMVNAVGQLSDITAGEPSIIGICSAGFVENGLIIEATNTGMKNFPLRKLISQKTGKKTYLYKDSWAPVFALKPQKPAIIFSIGTGFGGVSCEPDLTIRLKSYSARKRIMWIPRLYANDDPGYAVSFSVSLMDNIIDRAVSITGEAYPEVKELYISNDNIHNLSKTIKELAKKDKKLTPSWLELLLAKGIAAKAVENMNPDEVFADFPGASPLPGIVFENITGETATPAQMDEYLKEKHPAALVSFYIHSEFIGYILSKMQEERRDFNLPPAEEVYGTGSGYNRITHEFMSGPIVSAMNHYCTEAGLSTTDTDHVELIKTGSMATTFACLGAATGAAMNID